MMKSLLVLVVLALASSAFAAEEAFNSTQGALGISECQTAAYLRAAGFPANAVATMVCIAKYESSFRCEATNRNTDGTTDYGLFQINSLWWCSGGPKSKYNGCHASCDSMFNCQANANCARTVYAQQGFKAWYGYQHHAAECNSYRINC